MVMVQKKILYWGPGEAGKTTTFQRLKGVFNAHLVSKGHSIQTTSHRTLWNDSVNFRFLLPDFRLELIIILATTTGQQRFLGTREYILQNTDGVVFVGDSAPEKLKENRRSFQELQTLLGSNTVPILIMLNKRDLSDAISLEEFREALDLPDLKTTPNAGRKIIYECIATNHTESGDLIQAFQDMLTIILKQIMVKPT
jgi:hypothetical protein